ncbi:MAG TPA: Crp/Fnr family transcriptional regulator [Bacteroidales bacterium]
MDDFSEIVNCTDCSKSSGCFRHLLPAELEFINHNKTQILYSKGENICKEKAYASNVLYIADGLVKVYLESPQHNRNINLKILKASEFIGLSSIYGDNIYHYSAVALVDSTICMINKDSFRKILIDNGDFASKIIKWYCNKEMQLFNRIKSLGLKQMHGRLADVLLTLCDETYDQDILFNNLSRKDIADFACISTESTVRLLTELKNDGVIDLDGKKIILLDRKHLLEISRVG